jgi:two-component system CAI-1 autoinducer sensor kinase/phosphatase CqsS
LLEKNDLDFVTARKGSEVIDKFKSEKPDLILMDIWMPEVDGFEATLEIRNLEKDAINKVPIIAVTGHSSPEEIDMISSSGMDDYILKPFDFNKLLEKIRNLLNKK